jgi:hypothetical protein
MKPLYTNPIIGITNMSHTYLVCAQPVHYSPPLVLEQSEYLGLWDVQNELLVLSGFPLGAAALADVFLTRTERVAVVGVHESERERYGNTSHKTCKPALHTPMCTCAQHSIDTTHCLPNVQHQVRDDVHGHHRRGQLVRLMVLVQKRQVSIQNADLCVILLLHCNIGPSLCRV